MMKSRLEILLFVLLFAGLAMALITDTPAIASETINYTYDVHGRLVKVTHSGTVNNNVVVNYSFDNTDDRVNVNVTGAP